MNKYTSIDTYISSFPDDVQKILQDVRLTIKKAAPEADESISYQMPTFKQTGRPVVYFAAWKTHLGFYPFPSGNEAFKKELATYEGGKGTIKFPLDKPIPLDLITRIVKFRLQEISELKKSITSY